jgi:hypothetical protein
MAGAAAGCDGAAAAAAAAAAVEGSASTAAACTSEVQVVRVCSLRQVGRSWARQLAAIRSLKELCW